jgi:hypothetical protein
MSESKFHEKYSYKRTKDRKGEYLDITIAVPSPPSQPIVSKEKDEKYVKLYWSEQLDKAKAFDFEGDYNLKLGQLYSLISVQNILAPVYIIGTYMLYKRYTKGKVLKTNPLIANLKYRFIGLLKLCLFPLLPMAFIGQAMLNAQTHSIVSYQTEDLLGSSADDKAYEEYVNFQYDYERGFKNL